jgi:hypothetical protein
VKTWAEDGYDCIAQLETPKGFLVPPAARSGKIGEQPTDGIIVCSGKFSTGAIMGDGTHLAHTMDTAPGYSGSLVFARVDGKWIAVGVHCGALDTANLAYPF